LTRKFPKSVGIEAVDLTVLAKIKVDRGRIGESESTTVAVLAIPFARSQGADARKLGERPFGVRTRASDSGINELPYGVRNGALIRLDYSNESSLHVRITYQVLATPSRATERRASATSRRQIAPAAHHYASTKVAAARAKTDADFGEERGACSSPRPCHGCACEEEQRHRVAEAIANRFAARGRYRRRRGRPAHDEHHNDLARRQRVGNVERANWPQRQTVHRVSPSGDSYRIEPELRSRRGRQPPYVFAFLFIAAVVHHVGRDPHARNVASSASHKISRFIARPRTA